MMQDVKRCINNTMMIPVTDLFNMFDARNKRFQTSRKFKRNVRVRKKTTGNSFRNQLQNNVTYFIIESLLEYEVGANTYAPPLRSQLNIKTFQNASDAIHLSKYPIEVNRQRKEKKQYSVVPQVRPNESRGPPLGYGLQN